jgi:hypothetical protein
MWEISCQVNPAPNTCPPRHLPGVPTRRTIPDPGRSYSRSPNSVRRAWPPCGRAPGRHDHPFVLLRNRRKALHRLSPLPLILAARGDPLGSASRSTTSGDHAHGADRKVRKAGLCSNRSREQAGYELRHQSAQACPHPVRRGHLCLPALEAPQDRGSRLSVFACHANSYWVPSQPMTRLRPRTLRPLDVRSI